MLNRRDGSLGTGACSAGSSWSPRADVPFQTKNPPTPSTTAAPTTIASRERLGRSESSAAGLSNGAPRDDERVIGWIVGERTADGFEGLVVCVGGRWGGGAAVAPPSSGNRSCSSCARWLGWKRDACTTSSSASAISAAVEKRSARLRASAFSTTLSSSGGHIGFWNDGGGTSHRRTRSIVWMSLAPLNRRRP